MSGYVIFAQAAEAVAAHADVPETTSSLLRHLLQRGNMPFLVGIVAILSVAAVNIVKLVIVHRERIAKIEQGIDPDAPVAASQPPQSDAALDGARSYDSK